MHILSSLPSTLCARNMRYNISISVIFCRKYSRLIDIVLSTIIAVEYNSLVLLKNNAAIAVHERALIKRIDADVIYLLIEHVSAKSREIEVLMRTFTSPSVESRLYANPICKYLHI